MKRNGVFIAALVASLVAVGAYAQDKPPSSAVGASTHDHQSSSAMGGMKGGMMGSIMADDKQMMAGRQTMMGEMKASDTKLEGLLAQMNSATGAQKMDAIASVITELVAQQKRVHHDMMSMEPEMMRHMVVHMKSGTMAGMKQSMSMCPMMQGADGAKPGEDEPAKHHPGSQK